MHHMHMQELETNQHPPSHAGGSGRSFVFGAASGFWRQGRGDRVWSGYVHIYFCEVATKFWMKL